MQNKYTVVWIKLENIDTLKNYVKLQKLLSISDREHTNKIIQT